MVAVDAVYTTDCTGILTINDVPMSTYAWATLDLTPLWLPSYARRGSDVLMPGRDGLESFVRRKTAAVISLPFVVVGTCDADGTQYTDPWEGLEINIGYLRANVLDAMAQLPATLQMPSGEVRTADVQIEDFQPGDHTTKAQYNAVIGLSIAAGGFVAAAS